MHIHSGCHGMVSFMLLKYFPQRKMKQNDDAIGGKTVNDG